VFWRICDVSSWRSSEHSRMSSIKFRFRFWLGWRREVWSIFIRYNCLFVPPSILVCPQLRSTSPFLTAEPLFLLPTYPYTRNQSRQKAGKRIFQTEQRTTPQASVRESIRKRLHCFPNTLYVHKETIYYHRFRGALYVKWLEEVCGGGGVKTRELPCLNAKHVNIDSVTCFVDIT
jgi:hypothetical protein